MRMSFITNQIIKRNKKQKVYIYIYIYYLINCEYFNNLNDDRDMAGTGIMAGICTSSSSSPSPYPIEKIEDSPYPYPYPINAGFPRQNGDGFGQYPRGRVYLPSLTHTHTKSARGFPVKMGTGSGNTYVDEFICHLYVKRCKQLKH